MRKKFRINIKDKGISYIAIKQIEDDTQDTSLFSTNVVIVVSIVILLVMISCLFYYVMTNIPTHPRNNLNLKNKLTKNNQNDHNAQNNKNKVEIKQANQRKIKKTFSQQQRTLWNQMASTELVKPDPVLKASSLIKVNQIASSKQMLNCLENKGNCLNIYEQQRQLYQQKYQIQTFDEQPICVVVPTFNNIENNRYIKNIESILNQNYNNFRVLIIDDMSTDDTGTKLSKYILDNWSHKSDKIKIKINEKRMMALPNILYAAQKFCEPYQIFIIIDGDDYLLGRQVFKLFNSFFSNQEQQVWVAYSNFLTINNKSGYSRQYPPQICKDHLFRRVYFGISHLRAFYTKLILQIKQQDLKDDKGNWLKAANDVAIFMPILEMACDKIAYIKQLTYYYNSNTGKNNHKDKKNQQIWNNNHIRMRPIYTQLDTLLDDAQQQAKFSAIQNLPLTGK